MEITRGTLRTLGIGFSTAFKDALTSAATMYPAVATIVPSTTRSMDYGWLGKLPNIREWLGDRVVNNLTRFAYSVDNKDWEGTLEVDRNDIEDDNLGIYSGYIAELGSSAQAHKDQLVWPMLNNGFASTCYDGQYFFDTDHPVLDENGVSQSVANTDGGAGTPWFLIAKGKKINPVILQLRKDYAFVSKDAPNDDGVFWQKKFYYGTDARYNAGYGLWQYAWGSKNDLTPDNYAAARAALIGMKGDYGRPLGANQFALYYPPSLEAAALQVLNADRNADGSTNVWFHTADAVNVPWLA
ncbi:MAG: Mu-like prophage major head subunit gpT family protein [Rhizomicrobium sp.]